MPHAILNQSVDLNQFYNTFECIHLDKPIVKVNNIFLDRLKRTALLPSVVVESGVSKRFLIEVNAKDYQTTVRLYPLMDPEKTTGVKISLGLVVNRLLQIFPDVKVTKTNISDFICESR